jgi:hypothetical protein
MRGKIIDIHKRDAFYEDLDQLAGAIGTFDVEPTPRVPGFVAGGCDLDQPVTLSDGSYTHFIFFAVKVDPLPEEE